MDGWLRTWYLGTYSLAWHTICTLAVRYANTRTMPMRGVQSSFAHEVTKLLQVNDRTKPRYNTDTTHTPVSLPAPEVLQHTHYLTHTPPLVPTDTTSGRLVV